MAKPKRKSPDRRKPAPAEPGLLVKGGQALVSLIGRYPRFFVGMSIFGVAFGSVAANALWYQPGQHPSPLMRTRTAEDFTALGGVNRNPTVASEDSGVTTFRIAREGDPTLKPDAAADQMTGLVREIQTLLARRGFYEGEADGVIGPRTELAITNYQKTISMEPDGLVSDELLVALRLDTSITAAVPAQRPVPDAGDPSAIDPVAAAIRKAETQIRTVKAPEADRPAGLVQPKPEMKSEPPRQSAPVPAVNVAARPQSAAEPQASTIVADPGLVMEIQRGLTNMAFSNVTIDGIAGEATRDAIRRFERHYQLPVTGEPSLAVLKKLRAIGAL